MKKLILILLIVYPLILLSQRIIKENNRDLFVYRNCKIISNNPDCFNEEIPYNYRTNQVDTVRYCLDSCFLFYKGKCDTVCYNDTIELYFLYNNYYKNNNEHDSIFELTDVINISQNLKINNEPILYVNSDTISTIIRFAYYDDTLPSIIRIEKKENECIVYQKVTNRSFIWGDSLLKNEKSIMRPSTYKRLIKCVTSEDFFNNDRDNGCHRIDMLIEYKTPKEYKYIYRSDCDDEVSKSVRKYRKKLMRILKEYRTVPRYP